MDACIRSYGLAALLGALLFAAAPASAEETSETSPRLKRLLGLFPRADADGNGVLTEGEWDAFSKRKPDAPGPSPAPAARERPRDRSSGARPSPTFEDVPYGPHARNVLDFWKAEGEKPTPLIVFIHGGGFRAGDKSAARGETLRKALEAGVSYASINYRFLETAPIQEILRDAARAIQFLRSKAAEWNLDKARFAAHGGSAGAGTSLWLAFRDDLADPENPDPVLRESTRLAAAGSSNGQSTYDLLQWEELLGAPAERYGEDVLQFFHAKSLEELRGEAFAKARAEADMRGWISKDDPPVYLECNQPGGPSRDRGQFVHHPAHSQAIEKRCREVGVRAVLNLPRLDVAPEGGQSMIEFLLEQLKKPREGERGAGGKGEEGF
jgi:hypothetical protein